MPDIKSIYNDLHDLKELSIPAETNMDKVMPLLDLLATIKTTTLKRKSELLGCWLEEIECSSYYNVNNEPIEYSRYDVIIDVR